MTTARLRLGIGAVGVLVALYGAWLVLSRQEGFDRLSSLVLWLLGGVVVHDFVIAPVVLLLAWGAHRLGLAWRRPAVVALVLLGSLTLLSIPVLGRFGARPDNPTLVDRPYGWSWLVVAVLTLVLVTVAGLVGSRRRAVSGAPDPDAGSVGEDDR